MANLEVLEKKGELEQLFEGVEKTFIIGSVREASKNEEEIGEVLKERLKQIGVRAHLPKKDTVQEARGLHVCMQNGEAIRESDKVTLLYNENSKGTHFDLGESFKLRKEIIPLLFQYNYGDFVGMIKTWEKWGPGEREDINEEKKNGIFLICGPGDEEEARRFIEEKEKEGIRVFSPFGAEKLGLSKYEYCLLRRAELEASGEAHVIFNFDNQALFDLGMAFGDEIPLKVVKNVEYDDEIKSFPQLIDDLEKVYNIKTKI